MEQLIEEIEKIKARNKRVEDDKAWETSWFRIIFITLVTYLVALWFMYIIDLNRPYLNALVPTGGYFLSTLTIPVLKKWWIRKYNK